MKEKDKNKDNTPNGLREGEDYYTDPSGLVVFTRSYLIKRGSCCKSGCRNCPYGYRKSNLLDL